MWEDSWETSFLCWGCPKNWRFWQEKHATKAVWQTLKTAVANIEAALKIKEEAKISEAKEVLLRDGKNLVSDWMDKHHGSIVTNW